MQAEEIRREGIGVPGEAMTDGTALTHNVAMIVGALQEIAAQLAELNANLRAVQEGK